MPTTFTIINFNLRKKHIMKYHLSVLPQHYLLSSRMKCKPKDKPYVKIQTVYSSLINLTTEQMYIPH